MMLYPMTHEKIMARRIGADVVADMKTLVEMPDGQGLLTNTIREFKTVDGHVFSVSTEYHGFEGPDTLVSDPPA